MSRMKENLAIFQNNHQLLSSHYILFSNELLKLSYFTNIRERKDQALKLDK